MDFVGLDEILKVIEKEQTVHQDFKHFSIDMKVRERSQKRLIRILREFFED